MISNSQHQDPFEFNSWLLMSHADSQAKAGADIVMLDNYSPPELALDAKKLKDAFPHIIIEASGVSLGPS